MNAIPFKVCNRITACPTKLRFSKILNENRRPFFDIEAFLRAASKFTKECELYLVQISRVALRNQGLSGRSEKAKFLRNVNQDVRMWEPRQSLEEHELGRNVVPLGTRLARPVLFNLSELRVQGLHQQHVGEGGKSS